MLKSVDAPDVVKGSAVEPVLVSSVGSFVSSPAVELEEGSAVVTVENGVVVVDDSSDGSNVVTSLVLIDGEPAPQLRANKLAMRGRFQRRMIPLTAIVGQAEWSKDIGGVGAEGLRRGRRAGREQNPESSPRRPFSEQNARMSFLHAVSVRSARRASAILPIRATLHHL